MESPDADAVLDDIGVLARSPNRVALLERLAEGPATRDELRAAVDASRPTVSRALDEFGERGWVRRSGRTYEATPLGRVVTGAFRDLQDTMGTARRLRGVLDHLPLEEMDFDLSRLAEATVVTPDRADPTATIRRADRTARDADDLRVLSHAFSPGVIEAVHDRVEDGDQTVSMVVTDAVIERMREDREIGERLRDLVATDAVAAYRLDGEIPHVLAVADGTVSIGVDDEGGRPIAVIDTDDEVVHDWAIETFERYRRTAAPVTPADVDPDGTE